MAARICFLCTCACVALSAPALAQKAPTDGKPVAESEESSETPDIVVTGSRAIRDGSQAPTPVTVISADTLSKAQPGLIADGLNQLPVFRGSTRPTVGFTGATGPGTGSYLNLRNLGPQRTLVLVDGRRAAPSARDGSTDINLLPEQLIKRVDVVTGPLGLLRRHVLGCRGGCRQFRSGYQLYRNEADGAVGNLGAG